ncbi:GrpB family protein [Jatrophihabitans lederbergiae]|uniref:GrpB family protein n=1 Tax=Jatrophihabitans lederbergiae TaxID=3075547 RepID=UPI0037BE85B1
MSRPVIVPYSSDWPDRASALLADLTRSLGARVVHADHIGSTAIPRMAAHGRQEHPGSATLGTRSGRRDRLAAARSLAVRAGAEAGGVRIVVAAHRRGDRQRPIVLRRPFRLG